MSIKKISAVDFDRISASPEKMVLIKFYADWCGPCKQFAPILAKFADSHPELAVYEMNVDAPENLELMEELEISTIPTIILFRNGEILSRTSGFLNQRDLDKLPI